MLRVKDPAISLDFYSRVMGMRLLRKLDFPEMQFSLYFLQRAAEEDVAPEEAGERTAWTFAQRGLLELTHKWGTESDPDFRYHDVKRPDQGKMKNVAFIKDPDGYWIEILEPGRLKGLGLAT